MMHMRGMMHHQKLSKSWRKPSKHGRNERSHSRCGFECVWIHIAYLKQCVCACAIVAKYVIHYKHMCIYIHTHILWYICNGLCLSWRVSSHALKLSRENQKAAGPSFPVWWPKSWQNAETKIMAKRWDQFLILALLSHVQDHFQTPLNVEIEPGALSFLCFWAQLN
jgi:hypothetical protein